MDSDSSVVCEQQEREDCAANAEAEVLNALASALTEDSSVTAENSDCPVENSGSSTNNGSTAVSSTETTSKDCKPGLATPKKGEVLQGTLAVLCPDGTQTNISTLFDSGSGTDAISRKTATMLKQSGIAWGDAGIDHCRWQEDCSCWHIAAAVAC